MKTFLRCTLIFILTITGPIIHARQLSMNSNTITSMIKNNTDHFTLSVHSLDKTHNTDQINNNHLLFDFNSLAFSTNSDAEVLKPVGEENSDSNQESQETGWFKISKKKIAGYTFLITGITFAFLANDKNNSVEDLQYQYEVENRSYAKLLDLKNTRDETVESRDNYNIISISSLVVGGGFILWDLFSSDDKNETSHFFNDKKGIDIFAHSNWNKNLINIGICKKF